MFRELQGKAFSNGVTEWNQEFQEIKISLKCNTTITYTHSCSSQTL